MAHLVKLFCEFTNGKLTIVLGHTYLLFVMILWLCIAEWQVMCVFKSLNKDPNDQYRGLDDEDFERFYEVLDFRWSEVCHLKIPL